MRSRAGFAVTLLLQLAGGGVALLLSTRTWQTIRTPRDRPLADDVLHVTGRTVDSAPTALALVALAGVVAVLATRGVLRRVVGAVLIVDGVLLAWRALAARSAVSAHRALDLVRTHHPTVGVNAAGAPHVTVSAVWPALTAVCGVVVAAAGVLLAALGQRWWEMSARYDAPAGSVGASASDAAAQRARADATMWKALDAGDDPTIAP